jgi:hypothetical protein
MTPVTIEPPRILAISDVRLAGDPSMKVALSQFYHDWLGLVAVDAREQEMLRFRGHPRSGPQLAFIPAARPDRAIRRQAAIQVADLPAITSLLADRKCALEWSRGWFGFDRRLSVLDPCRNRIELGTLHRFGW